MDPVVDQVSLMVEPPGWQAVRGIRDVPLRGVECLCDVPDAFEYRTFIDALVRRLGREGIGRARAFAYREACLTSGLMVATGRNSYAKTETGKKLCTLPEEERGLHVGESFLRNPVNAELLRFLFGDLGAPHAVVVVQRGREAVLHRAVGPFRLLEIPARAIAWGLLPWLANTGAAQQLSVTVDATTLCVTDQLTSHAMSGRMFNLVRRHHVEFEELRRLIESLGDRGPNFWSVPVPRLLRVALENGVSTEAVASVLVTRSKAERSDVRLVPMSQSIALFGRPRVGRGDVRRSALANYLHDDGRVYSHVYLMGRAA